MNSCSSVISSFRDNVPNNYLETLVLARANKDVDWKKALDYYLYAHSMESDQPEPLLEIAEYYRCTSKNELSNIFARMAFLLISPNTPKDIKYRIYFEISISSYYIDRKEEGLEACDQLLLNKNVPDIFKSQAEKNQIYYITPIEFYEEKLVEFETPEIEDCDPRYNHQLYRRSNPCIAKTKDGYVSLVRAVNFLNNETHYVLFSKYQIMRSRTHIIFMDKNLNTTSFHETKEIIPRYKYSTKNEGLEDCRICREEDKENSPWYFMTTTTDTNERNISKVMLGRFKNEQGDIDKLILLKGPNPDRPEKNWMPFFHQGMLCMIYSYDPFIVYMPRIETGDCEMLCNYTSLIDMKRFKGSAPPIKYELDGKKGYLFITHEVTIYNKYHYFNRFLWMTDIFEVTKISKPFYFKQKGYEFCGGMCNSHDEDCVLISSGIQDKDASIFKVKNEIVRSMLRDVLEYKD